MYFYYGITHSKLEHPDEEIELKVDQNISPPAHSEDVEQTAVWDRHGYENRMAEDGGNSWSGGGGCWNAGNIINQGGWGDKPSITVSNNHNGSGYSAGSSTASKKPSTTTKSSSSKPKTRQPPPPPAKKPATTKASSSVPPTTSRTEPPSAPKKDGFGMFVEETHFPSWDD